MGEDPGQWPTPSRSRDGAVSLLVRRVGRCRSIEGARDAGGNDRPGRRTAHPSREAGTDGTSAVPDPPRRPDVLNGWLPDPVVDLQPLGAVLAASAAHAVHPASGAPHSLRTGRPNPEVGGAC